MIVNIGSKFRKKPSIITALETGRIYTDEKGEDYIFLGYGGYNKLIYNEKGVYSSYKKFLTHDDWRVWEANGDAPCSLLGSSVIKPIYMYIKVDKLLNLLGKIPDTYQELLEEILDKGYFSTDIYASINPRKFVAEKGQVLNDIDLIKDVIVENPGTYAYSFKFIEKLV